MLQAALVLGASPDNDEADSLRELLREQIWLGLGLGCRVGVRVRGWVRVRGEGCCSRAGETASREVLNVM
jgi:hypothetical protein